MLKPNHYSPFNQAIGVKLLLGGVVLSTMSGMAWAGSCTLTPTPNSYSCQGAAQPTTDTTQSITGSALSFTTASGFGISTLIGDALRFNTTAGLTFNDSNLSNITGASDGIEAINNGSGALSITTTGTVTGNSGRGIYAYQQAGTNLVINSANVYGDSFGIFANSYGSGSLSITNTGTVTGHRERGIYAWQHHGSNLTIQVNNVSGNTDGIWAVNDGSGALTINASGTVTGTNGRGIVAWNEAGTNLSINANVVSGGIFADNLGSGNLSITTTGNVTSSTDSGIYAINNGNQLTISAVNVSGGLEGIRAYNYGTGAMSINTSTGNVVGAGDDGIDAYNYGSSLTLQVNNVTGSHDGILAINRGTGALSITASSGTVTGTNGTGILAWNYGTDLTITANHVVGGIDAVNQGSGNLNITSNGAVSSANNDIGISAQNYSGSGSLTVNANGAVSGDYNGIYASNEGSGALSVTAQSSVSASNTYGSGIEASNSGTSLSINTNGLVSGGLFGINAIQNGSGLVNINVNATSTVEGSNAAINVDSSRSVNITNRGITRFSPTSSYNTAIQVNNTDIDNLNNVSNTVVNYGTIIGGVVLSGVNNSLQNLAGATWDSSGSTSDFGAMGTNSITNVGTLRTANGGASSPVQTTTFNNIDTFTHGGTLTMNNNRVGDTTVINGNYFGNRGLLRLDVQLMDDSSVADKLVINGNSAGRTRVQILNVGGLGAATLNGIEVITVSGISEANFTLAARVVAGAYEYFLRRGTINDKNWYLTSEWCGEDEGEKLGAPISRQRLAASYNAPPPAPDAAQPDGANGENVQPEADQPATPVRRMTMRSEGAVYAANLATANSLFSLRLHDRLGETSYTDVITGQQRVTSMWLRNEGGHNRFRDTSSQLNTQANRYVLQLGGDIAQWSYDGVSRFQLGVMAGYGNSNSNTVSSLTGYSAKGKVDGYSAGLYATWLSHAAERSGGYVDVWAQYSWLDNQVSGEGLPQEEYQSSGVTASLETGYALKIMENSTGSVAWFVQPQAQLIWMGVKADDHVETNGSRIVGDGDGNLQTRLGVKTFLSGHHHRDQGKNRNFEPFVEANWLHNSNDFASNLNEIKAAQDGARNIAELKIGVESSINRQFNLSGNISQQIGSKGYSDLSASLGMKYYF
ncbi:autotransporter outer membrane beta-barrel domain-containing protein [Serratia microhaemolytica]|uniref:autotransporter outer membrane beta-barrel domain-containing protein n=1 Tax=Serratia microhaemolytica TaxID=2675110 RepID=UPI000FDD74C5|nr:autotransporter outer membrane beta-barrel domain-containing protein [Serratia microhaemolytica]